jgi:hypothetical protein
MIIVNQKTLDKSLTFPATTPSSFHNTDNNATRACPSSPNPREQERTVMRHILRAIGVLALSTAGLAQAPYGYVVVAESAIQHKHNGLLFVDPDTGTFTRTRFRQGNDWIGTHMLVTMDPTDPKNIFAYAGFGIAGTPLQQFRMEGNRIASFGPATNPVWLTDPQALHVSTAVPGAVLYTTHRAQPGLWTRSTTDGKEQQIVSVKDAWEVTTAGGKIYLSTYKQGTASRLFQVDIKNKATTEVTLSANGGQLPVPAFRAMAVASDNAHVLIGDDNGVVWNLNPTTGAMSSMAIGPVRQGAIIAIAAHPTRVAYVATSNGVWDWVAFYTGKPLYTPTNKEVILDLDVSFHNQGAVIYHSNQCPGSKGQEPYVAFGGYPTQGNNQFGFGIASAVPYAPALGFVGLSRTKYNGLPLPLDLTGIGMPGCSLATDIVVVLNLTTNAQGGAMLNAAVPTDPALAGAHVNAQFAIQDIGANPAGISTTEGVELVIR